MINKFLYAYTKAKKNSPRCMCLFRIGDNYEVYYEDAGWLNAVISLPVQTRKLPQNKIVEVCVIKVDDIDSIIKRLHEFGIGTRLSEQRASNGDFDIVYDDYYYYELPDQGVYMSV